jgi:hypothetical protein
MQSSHLQVKDKQSGFGYTFTGQIRWLNPTYNLRGI